jgi:hypothetical protein
MQAESELLQCRKRLRCYEVCEHEYITTIRIFSLFRSNFFVTIIGFTKIQNKLKAVLFGRILSNFSFSK